MASSTTQCGNTWLCVTAACVASLTQVDQEDSSTSQTVTPASIKTNTQLLALNVLSVILGKKDTANFYTWPR